MAIPDKLTDLKFKLNSAAKQKLKKERILHSLRSQESSFTEEISLIKEENESFMQQINELTSQISQMKSQIIMIDVCRASEESKINVLESNLNVYKNEYDELYKKERDLVDQQNIQLKQKEAEEEEIEKVKLTKILERNEQQAKEAEAIEQECEAIERECSILTKRNKAIMLKLRKKLIETEDIRRELTKKKENTNEIQN
ncbi:unnamed protein product [Colias eurytheme]|nr:unnamed protein product [Colias eurytheme]